MSSERWNWEKEAARSLGGLKVKAPEAAWRNIENRLDAHKRRGFVFYLPWAAVVALAFVAGIFLYPDSGSEISEVKSGYVSSQELDRETGGRISEDGIAKAEQAVAGLGSNADNPVAGEGLAQVVEGSAKEEQAVAGLGSNADNPVAGEGLAQVVEGSAKEEQAVARLGSNADNPVAGEGLAQAVEESARAEQFAKAGRGYSGSQVVDRQPSVEGLNVNRVAEQAVRMADAEGVIARKRLVLRIASGILADETSVVKAELRPERGAVITEVEEPEGSRRVYALAGSVAPQYSFRNEIAGSDNAMFNQTGGVENLQKEHGYLAFSGGMDLAVKKDRWTFSSGVHFSRQGQQIEQVMVSKLVFPNNQSTSIAATSLGNILLNQSRSPISLEDINSINEVDYQFNSVTTEQVDATVTSTFDFVEIPFTAIYQVIDAPLEIKLLGGAGLAFLIDDKTEFVYQGNTTVVGGLPNLSTTNYQAMMGVQLAYPIRKSLSFYLQPVYKQSLNSLTKGLVIDYQPYQITFSTGLVLTF